MATAAPYTQASWATALLAAAALPTTPNNVQNIQRWMTAEEPPSNWWDRNNPLNASLGTSSTDGTGSYTNLLAGAAYTAKMLQQKNMSGIYNALKNNAPVWEFSAAVVASPWASGHYGGNPNAIANIQVPTQVPFGGSPGASGASAAGAADPGLGPSSGGPCQSAGCFFGFTVPSAAGILFGGGHSGCVCLMSKTQWKALTGAVALASGLALAGFGIVLLASAVGQSTGATQAVKKVAKTAGIGASLFAGQPEVAAGIAASSKATPKPDSSSRVAQSSARATQSRANAQRLTLEGERRETRLRVEQERGSQRRATQAQRPVSSQGARRQPTREPARRAPANVPGGQPF